MAEQETGWIPLPFDEAEEIRALLIEMRQYILAQQQLMGECVAWKELKRRFSIAQSQASWEADLAWVAQYRRLRGHGQGVPRC